MRKLEVDTVQKMIAERDAEAQKNLEEEGVESPLVVVSVVDLIFWAAEIFMIGACASMLMVLVLK